MDDLYFFRADNGLVKIGRSANVRARLNAVRCSSPVGIMHWATLEGRGFEEVAWHTIFKDRRATGEWFRWNTAIRRAIRLAQNGKERHYVASAPMRRRLSAYVIAGAVMCGAAPVHASPTFQLGDVIFRRCGRVPIYVPHLDPRIGIKGREIGLLVVEGPVWVRRNVFEFKEALDVGPQLSLRGVSGDPVALASFIISDPNEPNADHADEETEKRDRAGDASPQRGPALRYKIGLVVLICALIQLGLYAGIRRAMNKLLSGNPYAGRARLLILVAIVIAGAVPSILLISSLIDQAYGY